MILVCEVPWVLSEERAQVTEREVMVTILHVRCLVCHGRQRQEGGLDMQTHASLLGEESQVR